MPKSKKKTVPSSSILVRFIKVLFWTFMRQVTKQQSLVWFQEAIWLASQLLQSYHFLLRRNWLLTSWKLKWLKITEDNWLKKKTECNFKKINTWLHVWQCYKRIFKNILNFTKVFSKISFIPTWLLKKQQNKQFPEW